MGAINSFFKNLAESIGMTGFFSRNTLLFNNLFLLAVALFSLIAGLLILFLMPGKRKKMDYYRRMEERDV